MCQLGKRFIPQQPLSHCNFYTCTQPSLICHKFTNFVLTMYVHYAFFVEICHVQRVESMTNYTNIRTYAAHYLVYASSLSRICLHRLPVPNTARTKCEEHAHRYQASGLRLKQGQSGTHKTLRCNIMIATASVAPPRRIWYQLTSDPAKHMQQAT